jgi:small ligand-binding sensory domain FIST
VPYAAALSEHPLATHATGEVVGEVLDRLGGPAPDLAVLFVTRPHLGSLEDIAAAVRATLAPGTLLAASAVSVIGGREEAEEIAAVSLWAGHTGPVTALTLDAAVSDGTPVLGALGDDGLHDAGTLVLLADPASFPADDLLTRLAVEHPGLQVVGGMASAGVGPGANRLVLDDRIRDRGAVGVLIPSQRRVRSVVSQGCAPVGDPYTVTRAEGSMIHEIAGRPALERIREVIDALDHDQRRMAAAGLHLGRVVDEHKVDLDRGDFLVRNVLGADPSTGTVAVGDRVTTGDTVQLQVRDARSADDDLRLALEPHEASGALVFTCNGRGERFFGEAHHDATVISEALGTTAVGGMFCAGEIGPVGPRSHLHGFTASIALFD